MQTRNRSTVVVSESAVQAALRRAPARELGAEEDRAMRMRLGATVPVAAPLERKSKGNEEAEIELLAAEVEMFLRMRDQLRAHAARRAARSSTVARPSGTARSSATKTKIVRALRKKG